MRVLRGPLAGLAALITEKRVKSPALIVIGEVTAEPNMNCAQLALEGTTVKILTGNDLKTGRSSGGTAGLVAPRRGRGRRGEHADVDPGREDAACRVNGGYAIDGAPDADGKVRPAHIKDRIRAYGPTVRPDLTLKPADPEAGNWVI
jgi:hypothetical protein